MTLIHEGTIATQAIVDTLNANAATLGIDKAYYGMELLMPTFPAVECMSGTKQRIMGGGSSGTHKFEIDLAVSVTVLYGQVQSGEVNQKANEVLAEKIEALLNSDKHLLDADGNRQVIFGYVTRVTPRPVQRGNVMVRATTLLWEALSQEVFS